MGVVAASAIVAGIILGTSIFVQPSEISRLVPNAPAMMGVWLFAGLLTLCGAMACAELASAFPETGGVYVFLREGISPLAGFLWGWAMFWIMHSGIIAAIAMIVARYVGYFTPLSDRGVQGVAIGVILVLSGVNYFGVKQGSVVQTTLTSAKVLALALIFVLVFTVAGAGHVASVTASSAPLGGPLPGPRTFLLATIAGLFAFGGWHMVTYAAGETRTADRTIPRALLIGTLIVTVCYIGLNAAYLRVLPLQQMITSQRVAADAANALVGSWGAGLVSALVILSGASAVNGVILSGPRVYFAMAQDGRAFRWLAAIQPRFRTPHLAILAQAIWASVLVATGSYRALFTRVVFTEWIFFALMVVGIFRLRRRPGYAPTYRVWGYPIVPALFVVACAAIVGNQIVAAPRESAVGLFFVVTGWPIYYLFRA